MKEFFKTKIHFLAAITAIFAATIADNASVSAGELANEISGPPIIPLISNLPQFYRPNIIYEDGIYKMWTTAGDRIRYYTSSNGKNWSGGRTVFAASVDSPWELDGGEFEGYKGGISDPKIISGAVSGWKYAMYYTAGMAPNRDNSGGLGVAFSNDGINWIRSSHNPIRSFPGGNAFAVQAMEIRGKNYFYFYGGGNASLNRPPELRVAEILSNGSLGPDRVLPMGSNTYPLAYDSASDKCFFAEDQNVEGVPQNIMLYSGSDCFSNLGSLIGKVGRSETTNIYNFGGAFKERTPNGHFIRSNSIQFVFSSGNQWGSWSAASVSWNRNSDTGNTPAVPFVRATSNNILSGWAAERLIDGNAQSSYSSKRFDSYQNNNGTLVAAWFANSQTIGRVLLKARMNGAKALGFPVQYRVYITSADNRVWVDMGLFDKQPDATGAVEIHLPGSYSTFGLMIRPVEFGRDDYGSYYFQLAEMGLAY